MILIESKEYEEAFDIFNKKIYDFQKCILDPDLNAYDLKLPSHLRKFTSGYVYCKIVSIYADQILERLRKYEAANELYDFLLNKQHTYLQTNRARWFERMALNYEAHMKMPLNAFQVLQQGLGDKQCVRKAGRLTLYTRLFKMSETKKYLKIQELKESLKSVLLRESYQVKNAPVVEIEGNLLSTDCIPGRRNVFVQNFESHDEVTCAPDSDVLFKNSYKLSVEQVALTHYIKSLGFTHGKHAETQLITTVFGMLFWDIIFENNVENVFVDRFQTAPLDLGTDQFYLNRKELIDAKLELLNDSPIGFVNELVAECWQLNRNVQCSLVSWELFEDLDELQGLIKCFHSNQLANLCKYLAQNYRYCRSGGPDLCVWSTETNKFKFVEVKGPGDRLSFKQIVWLDFFIQNSIDCEVCYVKGKHSKRLR